MLNTRFAYPTSHRSNTGPYGSHDGEVLAMTLLKGDAGVSASVYAHVDYTLVSLDLTNNDQSKMVSTQIIVCGVA